MADHKIFNVLFLDTSNANRTIIAEVLMDRLGVGRFDAFSAGWSPASEVSPVALSLLRSQGFPEKDFRCKSWSEFASPDAPHMDFIFTLCDEAAKETPPEWPGHPITAEWCVPNPALATGNAAEIAVAYDETFRQLRNRINLLCELPIAVLDRMALEQHLREIGGAKDAA
jgi:arsenate reductase (thioredoxin)